MANLTPQQASFLKKYLGAKLPETSAETASGRFTSLWESGCKSWDRAVETVDAQIAQLQRVLKSSEDPELVQIAEFGLNAITGNHKVMIMASIRDVSGAGASPDSKIASKAKARIAAFDAHLSQDKRIEATDNNPFGVNVSIAATLKPALADLTRALDALS